MVLHNKMDQGKETFVKEASPAKAGDQETFLKEMSPVKADEETFVETVEEGCPVKPGDTLVASKPFIFAVNWESIRNVCQNCLVYKSGYKQIDLCPKCESVGYCSVACSNAQKKNHQLECEVLTKHKRRSWPHRAWFIARAILKIKVEGDAVTERINSKKRRAFKDLVDHYDDVTNDTKFTHNQWWMEEVKELLGDLMPDTRTYMSIYGKLLVNSFALRLDNRGEEENVGTALYRSASIFNHSCRPTATTVFSQGRLEVKAVVGSDSLDLDNYHISYLDEMEARDKRQSKLSKTWYFVCGCEACGDAAPVNFAVCGECRGPVGVAAEAWQWEGCGQCGVEIGEDAKAKYKEVFQLVNDVKDENGGECKHTDVASFLVRQMSDSFHELDRELVQAALCVAQGSYNSSDNSLQAIRNYKTAENYFRIALPGVRKHYRRYAGYLGTVLHQLADCLYHLDRMEEAVEMVKEAEEVLGVIPGRTSYYFIHYFQPIRDEIINKAEREKRKQQMANFVKQKQAEA